MGDPRPLFLDGSKRVFQVAVSNEELEERLRRTEPYSHAHMGGLLLNCTNITLVLLGLTTADNYLAVCTARGQKTHYEEQDMFINRALQSCGKPTGAKLVTLPRYSIDYIVQLADALLPGYATNIVVVYEPFPYKESLHSAFLMKTLDNEIVYIDAQTSNDDGSYPLKVTGMDALRSFFRQNSFTKFLFMMSPPGAIIHAGETAACRTTDVPTAGRRRRRRKTSRLRRSIRRRRTSNP